MPTKKDKKTSKKNSPKNVKVEKTTSKKVVKLEKKEFANGAGNFGELENKLDTKVKVSGKPIQIDNVTPAGIDQLDPENKKQENIVKQVKKNINEENQSDDLKKLTLPNTDILKKPKKDINKKEVKSKDVEEEGEDYSPEVLSSANSKGKSGISASVIWVIVLVLIIVGLLGFLGYWYWDQYGGDAIKISDELSTSRSTISSSTDTLGVSNIPITDPETSQDPVQQTISEETPEIDKLLNEIDFDLNELDDDQLPEIPNLEFDI